MKTYLSMVLLLISGCISSEQSSQPKLFTLQSDSLYFPIAQFHGYSIADTMKAQWYSYMLLGLKEPIIFNDSSSKEIFRFTWLRSFHHPISIRIVKSNDKIYLYSKEADGAGGYQPGRIIFDETRILSIDDWNTFMDYVKSINSGPKYVERDGLDGAQWILEEKSSRGYHVTDKWSPDEGDRFRECCEFLLRLSGIKIKKQEMY